MRIITTTVDFYNYDGHHYYYYYYYYYRCARVFFSPLKNLLRMNATVQEQQRLWWIEPMNVAGADDDLLIGHERGRVAGIRNYNNISYIRGVDEEDIFRSDQNKIRRGGGGGGGGRK